MSSCFSICSLCLRIISLSLGIFHGHVVGYHDAPDISHCNTRLGRMISVTACQTALSQMPRNRATGLNSVFASQSSNRGFTQLPLTYIGSAGRRSCVITIDLDGHSQNDVTVTVPWDVVRQVIQALIDRCASRMIGGMITYGLGNTLNALINPVAYDGAAIDLTAVVQQPDGSDTFAFLAPRAIAEGYSMSLSNNLCVGFSLLKLTMAVPSLTGPP